MQSRPKVDKEQVKTTADELFRKRSKIYARDVASAIKPNPDAGFVRGVGVVLSTYHYKWRYEKHISIDGCSYTISKSSYS